MFIVDAQLPKRLARELAALGIDALHTLELPAANRTADGEVRRMAVTEDRIVVSKDGDFVDWYLLHGAPPKLFFISTGSISPMTNCSACCAATGRRLHRCSRRANSWR